MSKKILVNATLQEENRVAIVEDGILTGLDIEVEGREPSKGNIYKAVVVRVESGLQAAFVDYGAERLGFLQIDEVNYATVKPDLAVDEGRRPRISDLLHRGQEILVQIVKEERGTKGAALTTYLSLAGRFMVLMPGSDTRGVSRRAESDSQRKQLKKAMSSLDLAEGVGYIVRTAALDQTREELERDYLYLIRLYENICALEKKVKAPTLIYRESNLIIRSIRDYFTTDMDEVLIDDPQVFQEAKDFFQLVMPDHAHLVKLHQERRPIFSRYQIEDQIETLSRNKVALPSGGSIVIDPTEALVAIDVNSGKMSSEHGVEATATKTNLEAAAEVGRQLRLRDLGGLIVIDFIDMRERKHMRQVEDALKKSLENDKARVSVGRISQFGLLEMSRQRIKAALTAGSHLTCPHCHGAGHIKSPESQAASLLRRIHAAAAKGQVARVEARLPLDVASYLLNHMREELLEMERRYQLQILILAAPAFLADQAEIEIVKKEKEKAALHEPVAARSLPPLPVEDKKPAAKGEPEPDDSDADENAAASGAEPAKKKRRRKRRKPAGEKPADATTPGEAGQEPAAGVAEEAPADTAAEAVTAPDETAATTGEADAPAKKPRRRRSRGKGRGKTAAADGTPAAAEPSLAPATDAPVQKDPVLADATDGAPPATAVAPQPQASPEAAAATAPAEQPKPKRPRRPAKKKTEPVATSAAPVINTMPPVEQSPAPPASVIESAEAPAAQAEVPPATTAAPPAKPARKPAARRAPRKTAAKPAESKGEAAAPSPAVAAPVTTTVEPDEKPKPKRPRRPAKKKDEPAAEPPKDPTP